MTGRVSCFLITAIYRYRGNRGNGGNRGSTTITIRGNRGSRGNNGRQKIGQGTKMPEYENPCQRRAKAAPNSPEAQLPIQSTE